MWGRGILARLAPAKINLTLHVTGRRADGYHELDSLVVFAALGDEVTLAPGAGLRVEGPFAAGVPAGADNLMSCAAAMIGVPQAPLVLTKRLPAAAGMGGGSSDAAAVLHVLAAEHGLAIPEVPALMRLGADLPVCMAAPAPSRMRDLGELVEPVAALPELGVLLVNPGLPLATPAVFAALESRSNPPMPERLPDWGSAEAFCAWLAEMRNDLELPARRLMPQIGDVLEQIAAQPGCALARMTGSGATCFGLFPDPAALASAERALAAPGRFVAATRVLAPDAQLTRATT